MFRLTCVVTALVGMSSVTLAQIHMPTVPIGYAGNSADSRVMVDGTSGYGRVDYNFNIGTYEVTAGQYTAFLNAVAATDPNGLYSPNQALLTVGSGITRSGVSGSYAYSVDPAFMNRPVNYVHSRNAARFANWLHNGQPTGPQNATTTEDGAYTLIAGQIYPLARNAGWQWALTSEDEWYKAAYYQPASQGGDTDDYWLYPTSSNNLPVAGVDANFGSVFNAQTPVGSYAANFFGTFDMGGNVWEWNESLLVGTFRGVRGGAFDRSSADLQADARSRNYPTNEQFFIGIRVSQVPAPSWIPALSLAGLLAAVRRCRTAGCIS